MTKADQLLPERANDVLQYWFGAAVEDRNARSRAMQKWFGGGDEVDREINERFGDLVDAAIEGRLGAWADRSPRGRLALILLLDQFTRNCFRGDPRAFAGDSRAQTQALTAIEHEEDRALALLERVFVYLPLEHAEDPVLQAASVAQFEQLHEQASLAGEDENLFRAYLDYAVRHRRVVDRFGRFPHRNEVLGRVSTAAEKAFLRSDQAPF